MIAYINAQKTEEVLSRNIFRILPGKDSLRAALLSGRKLRVYHGIDPTGPELHLGHATNLILLEKLRRLGHEAILLVGDFTALVGDPTGKYSARVRLSRANIEQNIKTWKNQAGKILDFENEKNPAKILKNSAWLSKLKSREALELLSNFTVGQMIERDMFQKRIKERSPIFLHEFLYPVFQGYDSVAMDVDIEIGGSDQLFNMGIGRVLQRKINDREKFIIATTLLENPKTKKKLMNKSEGSYIAISDKPENMYGKAMSLPDEIVSALLYGATHLSDVEVQEIEKKMAGGKNARDAKMKMAYELVRLYHSEKDAVRAQRDFAKTFQGGGIPQNLMSVFAKTGESLAEIVVRAGKTPNRSVFRRLVAQGAIKDAMGGEKINGINPKFEKEIILKIGKKIFLEIKENRQ